MKHLQFIFLIPVLLATSCYTTLDYKIKGGPAQLAVSGMLVVDEDHPTILRNDTITLTYSKEYTSTEDIKRVNDALLLITDQAGFIDTLRFIAGGKYITQKLVPIKGGVYRLNIFLSNGETYSATTYIPTRSIRFEGLPQIDTCRRNGTPVGVVPKGVYVEFDAYDPTGPGDAYWFKTFVRRKFDISSPYYNIRTLENQSVDVDYSKWRKFRNADNINFSVDNTGRGSNNLDFGNIGESKFTLPLRMDVTMFNENQSDYPAYFPGDSLKVDVYAVTLQHVDFLSSIKIQITNGSGGGLSALFARPPANSPTNLINSNPKGTKGLGWFGGGVLKSKAIKIEYKDKNGNPTLFIKDQNANANAYACP